MSSEPKMLGVVRLVDCDAKLITTDGDNALGVLELHLSDIEKVEAHSILAIAMEREDMALLIHLLTDMLSGDLGYEEEPEELN